MERTLFPEQEAETALHLALPPDLRPFASCSESSFEPWANRIQPALESLHSFRRWFLANYDEVLHEDTYTMLNDAVLIFQTVDALLALRLRSPVPTMSLMMLSTPPDLLQVNLKKKNIDPHGKVDF